MLRALPLRRSQGGSSNGFWWTARWCVLSRASGPAPARRPASAASTNSTGSTVCTTGTGLHVAYSLPLTPCPTQLAVEGTLICRRSWRGWFAGSSQFAPQCLSADSVNVKADLLLLDRFIQLTSVWFEAAILCLTLVPARGSLTNIMWSLLLHAGQLIAVAVVDILPESLSSKYFFWDPGHAWLSPGRLSALLEIEWVRAAGASCPSLRYYMMGFFIASCVKMSYKARPNAQDPARRCQGAHQRCWTASRKLRNIGCGGQEEAVLPQDLNTIPRNITCTCRCKLRLLPAVTTTVHSLPNLQ